MSEQPDFSDLGRSTPWSERAWSDAWEYLSERGETKLWTLTKDLMPLGSYGAPIAAAVALSAALQKRTTPPAETDRAEEGL